MIEFEFTMKWNMGSTCNDDYTSEGIHCLARDFAVK